MTYWYYTILLLFFIAMLHDIYVQTLINYVDVYNYITDNINLYKNYINTFSLSKIQKGQCEQSTSLWRYRESFIRSKTF